MVSKQPSPYICALLHSLRSEGNSILHILSTSNNTIPCSAQWRYRRPQRPRQLGARGAAAGVRRGEGCTLTQFFACTVCSIFRMTSESHSPLSAESMSPRTGSTWMNHFYIHHERLFLDSEGGLNLDSDSGTSLVGCLGRLQLKFCTKTIHLLQFDELCNLFSTGFFSQISTCFLCLIR